ncbi:MAG: peptidoglycan-binding domain-containing protein, partial [Planctomycetota bacterium]
MASNSPDKGRSLSIRMKGDDVKQLQSALQSLGYSLKADGYFGKITKSTVLRFQEQNGINPTGKVDKDTARLLTREIESLKAQVLETDKTEDVAHSSKPEFDKRSGPDAAPMEVYFKTLTDVLETRLADKSLRINVARAWIESGRDPVRFKSVIEQDEKLSAQSEAIRFTLEISEKVTWHLPLIQRLERYFDDGTIKEPEDLVEWRIEQWQDVLGKGEIKIPDNFSLDNDQDSIKSYARHLRISFERAYPEKAIRLHIAHHPVTYSWGTAVNNFLVNNPSVDPTIPVVKLEKEFPCIFKALPDQQARDGLATIQRLYKLTGSLDAVPAFVDAGLTSSRDIARNDPEDFANRFAAVFNDNREAALDVHASAIRNSSLVKLTFAEFSEQFNRTPFTALKLQNL